MPTLKLLAVRSIKAYVTDGCGQHAAAISYYVLFSIFPVVILLAVGFGLVADDAASRRDTINFLLDNLPLSEGEGRRDLERLFDGVTSGAGALGIAGLAALVYSASGLMASIRGGLGAIWRVEKGRHFLKSKGLDLLLVLSIGVLAALSLALTLVNRLAGDVSADLEGPLGPVGSALGAVVGASGTLISLVLSAAVVATLYKLVPVPHTPLRDIWPGVLFAALAYELAKWGFSLYLENFANYSAVYGSLGAVVAFLVFVSIAANVLLLGAEVAARWPEVRAADTEMDGA